MHSFEAPSGTTYSHNGDFSGDVQFTTLNADLRGTVSTVVVPFDDFKALVAEYVRRKKIESVERMTDDQALGRMGVEW